MAKKRRKIKISKGALVAVFVALVPFVLLVNWIITEFVNPSGNEPEMVEVNIPNYYKFCQTGDPLLEINKIKEGLIPEQIVIESQEINLPIVSVPLDNGSWLVNDGVANYAEGTSLVNPEGGNVGIYGHDRPYVFSAVKKLQDGDEIFIFTKEYRVVYVVDDSIVSDPSNVEVFYPTDDPVLTLVTCEGAFSQERYIIKAKFDRIEQLNCSE